MSEVLERFGALFDPESIAVIGATNSYGKWGYVYPRNILAGGYKGRLYPVHPKSPEVLGLPAYKSVKDIKQRVDLALILLRPELVYEAVRECIEVGVRAIVVISAGFGEVDAGGRKLEQAMAEQARKAGILLIGPNCMGLVNVHASLNSQLYVLQPSKGGISVVSQSGNIGGNIIRQSIADGIGFSKFLSSGNEAVTTCEEILEYYAQDPATSVVLAYIEGVKDGPRFISACRAVSSKKPLVMLKSGYTDAGSLACSSHTGALAGSEEVFNAVCRQTGIMRVYNVPDLYTIGATLAAQPLPRGNRIGIITEGGGLGVIAADACVAHGLEVPRLPQSMISELSGYLEDRWSHGNPIDTAAGKGKYKALEHLIRSDLIDGIIQVGVTFSGTTYQALKKKPQELWTDQDRARLERVEERLERELSRAKRQVELSRETGKPILSCDEAVGIAGIRGNPTLEFLSSKEMLVYPDPYYAARAMDYLVRYSNYLQNH